MLICCWEESMGLNISGWKFDPATMLVTLVLAPIALYAALTIRRFVKSSAKYVIDGFVYSLNKTFIHKAAATLTLKRYCRMQLVGPNQYLRIPSAVELNLNIDDTFVPLVLEQQGLNQGFDNNNILTAGSRLRVIGDPGSGKSSVSKRIFRDECKRALSVPRRARFPVLIELRSTNIPTKISSAALQEWLFKYIHDQINKYDVYELSKCFLAFSRTAGLLVILDGLDEVASSAYNHMERAINGLSQKLNQLSDKNVVLLTMRTQFHQQIRASFSETFPVVLSIRRFLPGDIYEFLRRWPFPAQQKATNVVRIYSELTDRPTLREMCTNPLVLSMYVAQDQISGDSIAPDSRTDFYQRVTDELLIKRRAKQIGQVESQTIVREQRQRVLGIIAFRHLLDVNQTVNRIAWTLGLAVVKDVTKLDVSESETYLRELSKETGLITEEQQGETFRFIHLTFCEYFCAFEAIQGRSDGWQAVIDAHIEFGRTPALRARLVEVLPFAAALMPRHLRVQAIIDVAKCNDRHLMALTFLETKLYSHELWPRFLNSSQEFLVARSEDNWDSEWLSEVHLFLVVASDAERSAAAMPEITGGDGVLRFFQDFARKSSTAIARLIKKYSEQDAVAAFRVATLCGVDIFEFMPGIIIDRLDQPLFVDVALERAAREPKTVGKWASLFAEAGLRSRAAASVLSAWSQRPWRQRADETPRRCWWYIPRIVNANHFTDCLALGCAEAALNQSVTPLLFELQRIPGPNAKGIKNFAAQFFVYIAYPLFLILYAGSLLLVILNPFPRYLLLSVFGLLPEFLFTKYAAIAFSAIAIASLVITIASFYWARVYANLINLAEHSSRLSPTELLFRLFRSPRSVHITFKLKGDITPLDVVEVGTVRQLLLSKATILRANHMLKLRRDFRSTLTLT
jgi:NACHT domain